MPTITSYFGFLLAVLTITAGLLSVLIRYGLFDFYLKFLDFR